jgi:hypothetical protein
MSEYRVIKYDKNYSNDENKLVDYVIYSHSSFIDILNIQIDHLYDKGKLTLFIEKNDLDLSDLYSKFSKIVFYDDSLSYGQKVLSCLYQIDYEYFIFIHDCDIVCYVDNQKINDFFNFLKSNNYDRIDFQLAYDFNRECADTIKDDDLYFIKSSNTDTDNNGYIYNVNPSIWKRETFIKILETHGYRDYRTIEHPDVQKFCLQFEIFKLYSKNIYRCGYFICLEPFRYIHITHNRKLLSLSNLSEESCKDIKDDYTCIINKYNLTNSSKWERW